MRFGSTKALEVKLKSKEKSSRVEQRARQRGGCLREKERNKYIENDLLMNSSPQRMYRGYCSLLAVFVKLLRLMHAVLVGFNQIFYEMLIW